MKHKRILLTLSVLTTFVMLGATASRMQKNARNLQVLPKDISDQKLDSIMQSYNKALGVNCDFCHSPSKLQPDNLDFASDSNGMKEAARYMMRLTIGINKTWFNYDTTLRPEYLTVISCKTCHQGHPFPPGN